MGRINVNALQKIPQRGQMAYINPVAQVTKEQQAFFDEQKRLYDAMQQDKQKRMKALQEVHDKAFEEGFRAGFKEGTDTTLRMMYASMCLALNRLYGFGAKRCFDTLVETAEEMMMHIDSEDAADQVLDTIGLRFMNDAPLPSEQVQVTDSRAGRLKKFREAMKVVVNDGH